MNGGVRTKPCAFSGCFIPAWGSPRTGLQGSNVSLWREARGFARGKTDQVRWHKTDGPWQGYRPQCRVFTEKPCFHNLECVPPFTHDVCVRVVRFALLL